MYDPNKTEAENRAYFIRTHTVSKADVDLIFKEALSQFGLTPEDVAQYPLAGEERMGIKIRKARALAENKLAGRIIV